MGGGRDGPWAAVGRKGGSAWRVGGLRSVVRSREERLRAARGGGGGGLGWGEGGRAARLDPGLKATCCSQKRGESLCSSRGEKWPLRATFGGRGSAATLARVAWPSSSRFVAASPTWKRST